MVYALALNINCLLVLRALSVSANKGADKGCLARQLLDVNVFINSLYESCRKYQLGSFKVKDFHSFMSNLFSWI